MKKMKQFNILISKEFNQDLERHIAFLARKSPTAAKNIQKTVITAVRSLSTMPERHPLFPDANGLSVTFRHFYIKEWYKVIYHIVDDTVYIDYIIDCRQDPLWLQP